MNKGSTNGSEVGVAEVILVKFVNGGVPIILSYFLLLFICFNFLFFSILAVAKFREISACRVKHNASRTNTAQNSNPATVETNK